MSLEETKELFEGISKRMKQYMKDDLAFLKKLKLDNPNDFPIEFDEIISNIEKRELSI